MHLSLHVYICETFPLVITLAYSRTSRNYDNHIALLSLIRIPRVRNTSIRANMTLTQTESAWISAGERVEHPKRYKNEHIPKSGCASNVSSGRFIIRVNEKLYLHLETPLGYRISHRQATRRERHLIPIEDIQKCFPQFGVFLVENARR